VEWLERQLKESREDCRRAKELVDGTGWDFLHELVRNSMEEFSRMMSGERDTVHIFRAQGAYKALMALINKCLALAEGELVGKVTLKELEEMYARKKDALAE
jgi:hypothetical protein